jgi:Lar family restriction alleviation protein
MPKRERDKPCPFCGSTDLDPSGGDQDAEHWIVCNACGAQGPYATIGCRDPDEEEVDLESEAVELWNKRVAVVSLVPSP